MVFFSFLLDLVFDAWVVDACAGFSEIERSVSFPLTKFSYCENFGFSQVGNPWIVDWCCFLVAGKIEWRKERKIISFKVFWCVGGGYEFVQFGVMKEFDGFWDWIDFLFVSSLISLKPIRPKMNVCNGSEVINLNRLTISLGEIVFLVNKG